MQYHRKLQSNIVTKSILATLHLSHIDCSQTNELPWFIGQTTFDHWNKDKDQYLYYQTLDPINTLTWLRIEES